MAKYSLQERVDMVFVLGECEQNDFLASRVYAQKYPDRRHPDKRMFRRLLEKQQTTGNVAYAKAIRKKPILGEEQHEFFVVGSVVEDPHTSQRSVSRATGISRSSIQRLLRKNNFHPYKIQFHQTLYPADFEKRLEFCMNVMDKCSANENFLDIVLFSDECSFHNDGMVNRHNFHFYSDVNPQYFRTIDRQHRWSVNVWGGILGTYVIGPHFFDAYLNGEIFLYFLLNDLSNLLEDVPLEIRRRMWLQLDGAPAHFHGNVINALNQLFPNKWIGRGSPYAWPPRSPDLTAADFFLWGYIKNIVYQTPPTTPLDMKQRIKEAFSSITPAMLLNVKRSMQKRLELCIVNDGGHFEKLL